MECRHHCNSDTLRHPWRDGPTCRCSERENRSNNISTELRSTLDIRGNDRETPLHSAVQGHHATATALLLERGADVNARDSSSATPLHLAAEAERTDLSCAKLLLETGANANAKDEDRMTPLHYAVEAGNIEVVKLLLDSGADIEANESEGRTPLHIAAENAREPEIVELLLDRGAILNARTTFGETATI